MAETSLVSLEGPSKVAIALIDRVSEVLGGIAKPYQMKRIARAQAEVDLIKTQSEIEITDLHRRAMRRFIEEEAQRQENIEAITDKATEYLEETARPEAIETDWIVNFFERCRVVSDEEMQLLWAQLMACEANDPGTVSRKTVNLLSDLSPTDAELLDYLSRFVWYVGAPIPLIFDIQNPIYLHRSFFEIINHLESLGLIHFAPVSGYNRIHIPKEFPIYYQDRAFMMTLPKSDDNTFTTGKVLFTFFGMDLLPFCHPQPVEGFVEYVISQWNKEKITVREITDQSSKPELEKQPGIEPTVEDHSPTSTPPAQT